jgi:predicted Zn-dependent protease
VNTLITDALTNPLADGRAKGMLHAVAMDYAAAKLGSPSKALVEAQAAVESDPGSVSLRINLIRLLLRLNKTEDAKRQYAVLRGGRIPVQDRDEVSNLGIGLSH